MFHETMELFLGVAIVVLVNFFALYLTRKLRMAEEEVARDAQRDAHNNRILLELVEQVRGLHHLHVYCPVNVGLDHRSRYLSFHRSRGRV